MPLTLRRELEDRICFESSFLAPSEKSNCIVRRFLIISSLYVPLNGPHTWATPPHVCLPSGSWRGRNVWASLAYPVVSADRNRLRFAVGCRQNQTVSGVFVLCRIVPA